MARIPSGISGKDMVKILECLGFSFVRHKGSHTALRRPRPTGGHDAAIVPQYNEIDKGLIREILRQCNVDAEDFCSQL